MILVLAGTYVFHFSLKFSERLDSLQTPRIKIFNYLNYLRASEFRSKFLEKAFIDSESHHPYQGCSSECHGSCIKDGWMILLQSPLLSTISTEEVSCNWCPLNHVNDL
jgi:hypothetical protein